MEKPRRRVKKRKRYDFLKKEWIRESDDYEEMDWTDEEYDMIDCEGGDHNLDTE